MQTGSSWALILRLDFLQDACQFTLNAMKQGSSGLQRIECF